MNPGKIFEQDFVKSCEFFTLRLKGGFMRFIIAGKLPSLNDYTRANRGNYHIGNKMKRDTQAIIKQYLPIGWEQYKKPVRIEFKWYEPNARRDIDNVAFAKKFILDALVEQGVLINDSQEYVKSFTDEFYIDKKNPRIEVNIYEM